MRVDRTMLSRIALAAMPLRRAMSVPVTASGVLLFGLLSVAGLSGSFPTAARAQAGSPDDAMYRIERLENQLRQLTGEIEQLQYRNQQLEAAVNELRGGARGVAAPPPAAGAAAPPLQGPGAPVVYGGTGRRSDAFDPAENPTAPGAPRTLGSVPPQPPPPNTRPGMQTTPYATGPAGGPDQGYARPPAGVDQGYGRPPAGAPPQQPGAANPYPVATAAPPPSGSPREVYDAGVVYLQRRDYGNAEETFRDFLRRYPTDRLAAEAQYDLGESLFQLQNYQEAADAFVQMSKKYETSAKAADGLLRLGQSLAAMNETELACVAFADVGRKYPRARPELRQAVEREQKRARCS
jgi:tol-pal system protein YbgF